MKVLPSLQCGVGFDSSNVCLEFSLFLVLVLALKTFPQGLKFFFLSKSNISIFLFGLRSKGLVFLHQLYMLHWYMIPLLTT